MAQPHFFVEGHSPRRSDTQWKIEQKILGAIIDNGGGGGGGGGGLAGAGSPEGAVTASPGTTYFNTSDSSFWVKATGAADTGWIPLLL